MTPDDRELSAQYLLLYELSLPYGLDLNDRDQHRQIRHPGDRHPRPRVLHRARAKTFFADVAMHGMQANLAGLHAYAQPTSAAVMFTYISERNMQNMITGTH